MGPGFHSALRRGLTPIASWLDTLRKGQSAALVFVYRHPAGEAERFVDIACEGCNSMPVCIAGVSDHAILQWGSAFLVSLPFRPLLLPISPESTQLSNNRFALIKVYWLRMVKSPESKTLGYPNCISFHSAVTYFYFLHLQKPWCKCYRKKAWC